MLNLMRRILGNGEKIAIGNKICMGIFIFFCIVSITTLWQSRSYTEIESAKMAAYNKLKADLANSAEHQAKVAEVKELEMEIVNLQAKLADVKKENAPYHTQLEERRKAEALKQAAKAKLEEDFKLQFSLWNGSHDKTVKHVKARMHNPKSFEHVETRYIDLSEQGYRIIFMQYRGTNVFNAVVTNSIRVKVDLDGNVIEVLQSN